MGATDRMTRGAGAGVTSDGLFAAAAWGAALWGVVALAIRLSPAVLFARGGWTLLLFALAVPNAILTVALTRRALRLAPGRIVPATAIACAAAMMCDAVALTWTRLYEPGVRDQVSVGALLLWGVALILIEAVRADPRPTP